MNWFKGLTIPKDPDSVLDWAWDFSSWLNAGDTLSTHNVTVDAGLTLDSSVIDDNKVIMWLSGGTAGNTYSATVHIVTTAGRQIDRTVDFKISER